MTGVLLFCTADSAREVARKALNEKDDTYGVGFYWLVESCDGPQEPDPDGNGKKRFKGELKDDESFDSDFIGASEEDCRQWIRENQQSLGMIDHNIIAIADERSSEDGTLSLQYYEQTVLSDEDGKPIEWEFDKFGVLPHERDTWYVFRVKFRDAYIINISLNWVPPDVTFEIFFGLKDALTDEHGVFDAAKANQIILSNEKEKYIAELSPERARL